MAWEQMQQQSSAKNASFNSSQVTADHNRWLEVKFHYDH